MAEIELDEQEYLIPLAIEDHGWTQHVGHIAKVGGIEFSIVATQLNYRYVLRISELKSGGLVYTHNLDDFVLLTVMSKSDLTNFYKEVLFDFAKLIKDKIESIKEQAEKLLNTMIETYGDMPKITIWKSSRTYSG